MATKGRLIIGKMFKGFVSVIAISSMCATVLAAEMVDNPRYLDWSKYKLGTFIKRQWTTVSYGQNIKQTMDHHLEGGLVLE